MKNVKLKHGFSVLLRMKKARLRIETPEPNNRSRKLAKVSIFESFKSNFLSFLVVLSRLPVSIRKYQLNLLSCFQKAPLDLKSDSFTPSKHFSPPKHKFASVSPKLTLKNPKICMSCYRI